MYTCDSLSIGPDDALRIDAIPATSILCHTADFKQRLRTIPHVRSLSKRPSSPECDWTEHYERTAAIILGLGDKPGQLVNHRKGIGTTLERFRAEDPETLDRLTSCVDALCSEERPLLTDSGEERERKNRKRDAQNIALKYVRFLLSAYFTELSWAVHEQRKEKQDAPPESGVTLLELDRCVDLSIKPLKEELQTDTPSYAASLYSLYERDRVVPDGFFGPVYHLKAGNKTGVFYSREFLRITPTVYRQYLREQIGRTKLVESDRQIIEHVGFNSIQLVETFASVDMGGTFQPSVVVGSGQTFHPRESRFRQNPAMYCIGKRSVRSGIQWTLELRPELLRAITGEKETTLACPASYALAADGKRTVLRALCEEQWEHWRQYELPLLF